MKVLISTSAMQFLNVVMFPWKFTPQTRVGKQLKITHCFIWSTNYIVPLFAHERSSFQKYFVWMVTISTRVFPSTTTLLKSYLTMQIFSQQRLHFVNFSRQSCVINGIPRILIVIFFKPSRKIAKISRLSQQSITWVLILFYEILKIRVQVILLTNLKKNLRIFGSIYHLIIKSSTSFWTILGVYSHNKYEPQAAASIFRLSFFSIYFYFSKCAN